MQDNANRIRQARRHAGMSQSGLAGHVGVHRSAVAKWEQPRGCLPTVEHFARIALSTSVSFEWLTTGRGRMAYLSDILPGEETPVVLVDHSAQSETEVRALTAMRRLEFPSLLAVVDMIEGLASARELRLHRRTPYSR